MVGVKTTPKRPKGSFKWVDPKTGIGYRKKLRCIAMTDPGWAYLCDNKQRIINALERMGGLIQKTNMKATSGIAKTSAHYLTRLQRVHQVQQKWQQKTLH